MVDMMCFSKHIGYSFSQLFDHLIAPNSYLLLQLQEVDYCIIAHSTPEYDPDFTHVGVYLKNRYGFAGEIIDVMASNGAETEIAFQFMLRFFELKTMARGAVIRFEQSVIPVSTYSDAAIPRKNNITLYLFEFI